MPQAGSLVRGTAALYQYPSAEPSPGFLPHCANNLKILPPQLTVFLNRFDPAPTITLGLRNENYWLFYNLYASHRARLALAKRD
jgi:hypothetical protein